MDGFLGRRDFLQNVGRQSSSRYYHLPSLLPTLLQVLTQQLDTAAGSITLLHYIPIPYLSTADGPTATEALWFTHHSTKKQYSAEIRAHQQQGVESAILRLTSSMCRMN